MASRRPSCLEWTLKSDFPTAQSAAFDSSYGALYWVLAYYRLNRGRLWAGPWMIAQSVLNIFIFLIGLFMLGPGLYVSFHASSPPLS